MHEEIREKAFDRLNRDSVEKILFLGYRGSHGHGTYRPNTDPNSIDDIDVMGVYLASIGHYFGFGRDEVIESFPDELDLVAYELRKFVHLLKKNNPNVLGMLWLEPESVLYQDWRWRLLVENRKKFASKLAYHTFTGYAHQQLKKMTHVNHGVLAEINNLQEILVEEGGRFEEGNLKLPAGASNRLQSLAQQYEAYRKKYFAGYMGHKRKSLVERFGYDTKNAGHLIRLLRMNVEFMEMGEMIVKRPDAAEIMAIKNGEWPLENVKHEADALFLLASAAHEKSKLPEKPDDEAIERILINLLREYYYDR